MTREEAKSKVYDLLSVYKPGDISEEQWIWARTQIWGKNEEKLITDYFMSLEMGFSHQQSKQELIGPFTFLQVDMVRSLVINSNLLI